MTVSQIILLVLVGLSAGLLGGTLGVGGGIVVIPALVFLFGFNQHAGPGNNPGIHAPTSDNFGDLELLEERKRRLEIFIDFIHNFSDRRLPGIYFRRIHPRPDFEKTVWSVAAFYGCKNDLLKIKNPAKSRVLHSSIIIVT